jgi:hypothetical protein
VSRHPDDIQNSIDNIAYAVLKLETEKWVLGIEVDSVAMDMLQQVIDRCRDRMLELNAEKQIGDSI